MVFRFHEQKKYYNVFLVQVRQQWQQYCVSKTMSINTTIDPNIYLKHCAVVPYLSGQKLQGVAFLAALQAAVQ